MPKAQALRPVMYVFGIGVLAFALFLFIGFKATQDTSDMAKTLQKAAFITDLQKGVETISLRPGSVLLETYRLPGRVRTVCIADTTHLDASSHTLDPFPEIRSSVASGTRDNLFVYSDKFLYSSDVGPITISDYPYIKCFPTKRSLQMKLKGTGAGSNLIEDFKVSAELGNEIDRDITLTSVNRLAELSFRKGTVVNNALTVSISPAGEDEAYLPNNLHAVGETYLLEPNGASFDPGAIISIAYSESALPDYADEKDIVIWHLSEGLWTPLDTTVDTKKNIATAKISSFCHVVPAVREADIDRHLPEEVDAYEVMEVKLRLDTDSPISDIKENIPEGWEIVDAAGAEVKDNELRWPDRVTEHKNIKYKLKAPGQEGEYHFEGYFLNNGKVKKIRKDHEVRVTGVPQQNCYDSGWVIFHKLVVDGSGCNKNSDFPGGWDCYIYRSKWHKLRFSLPSSGAYEVSFKGHFSGPCQSKEDVRIESGDQQIDWHESNEWDKGWYEFTMPEVINLKQGSNDIVVKSPNACKCGSVHFGKVRITNCEIGTCEDGIQNQGETGVDCGGPCSPCVSVPSINIRPEQNSVAVGEQFSVAVVAKDVEDLDEVRFSLKYDDSLLRFEGMESEYSCTAEPGLTTDVVCKTAITGYKDIVKFTFTAIAPGTAGFAFDGLTAYNSQHDSISLETGSAEVTITGESMPEVQLVPSTTTPELNGQFIVSVDLKNAKDISGFQATIEFDASLISYEGMDNGPFMSDCPVEIVKDGSVKIGCVAFGESGITGSGTIALLRFKAVSPGVTTMTPNDLVLVNSNSNELPIFSSSITLYVGGASGPRLSLHPSDYYPPQDQEVSLRVEANDVENLMGVEFSIIYDSDKLQYNGMQAGDFLASCPVEKNENGRLRFACVSLSNAASGSGTLMTLSFMTIKSGTTTLTPDGLKMVDSESNLIQATAQQVTLNIGGQNTCANGVKDIDELGIDCGGACSTDCCVNGFKDSNIGETGIDCGGQCDVDCCQNSHKDTGEEGVDCGGSCPPCPDDCTKPCTQLSKACCDKRSECMWDNSCTNLPEGEPENCFNHKDDDLDGAVDKADSDCWECTSGPCCNQFTHSYRTNVYACSILATEYFCKDTSCGSDVYVRNKRRYCTGKSSQCQGSMVWDSSYIYKNCGKGERCSPGSEECVAC